MRGARSDPPARPLSAHLEVLNRQRKVRLDIGRLKTLLRAAMEAAGVAEAEVDLILLSDRAIRVLNREWRGQDRPTDCLSFPSGEPEPSGLPGPRHLGDIAISVERALAQGLERARPGTPKEQALTGEVVHLFVHSLLHLLGHDHETDPEARRMRAAERRVLRRVRPR